MIAQIANLRVRTSEQLGVLTTRTRFFKESQTDLILWVTSLSKNHFPTSSCKFESRDEILLKGGRLWRPRFLIAVINANDRISRVKPTENRSNLGQHGSSPQKPRQWTKMNPLTKSTHIRGEPLVKGTVRIGLTVDVSECRPELLPLSPKFT
jgi:hypothetical protein